jgi:hypothetical protein
LARASKIKCSVCGLKGAALGCLVKSCRKSYHVPCAHQNSGCRWDEVSIIPSSSLSISFCFSFSKCASFIVLNYLVNMSNRMNVMCFRKTLLCFVLLIHQRSCLVRGSNRKRSRCSSMFFMPVIHCSILPDLSKHAL